ncbi:MAG: hypothetical protein QXI60_00265 [Thermofilaceae archaeon]
MDSPKYIEAVYRVEPDLLSIIIIGSVATAFSAAYYFSKPKKSPKPENKNAGEQASETIFCHNCGTLNSRVFSYCLKCGSLLHQSQGMPYTKTSGR